MITVEPSPFEPPSPRILGDAELLAPGNRKISEQPDPRLFRVRITSTVVNGVLLPYRADVGASCHGTQDWPRSLRVTLRHALGEQKPFDRLFNIGPIRWSGDFSTVSQSGAPPLNPLGNPSAIASLRMVVDVGNWDASRFSLPGGQSGNPLSPHYADQVEPWRTGAGVPMPYSAEAVTNATTERECQKVGVSGCWSELSACWQVDGKD